MFKGKKRGSTTLEAVIIMPTILLMIFAIFFAFQFMYQYVVIEYAVSTGATKGAMMWDYEADGVDFEKGTVGDKVWIYNNLVQMLTGSGISDREKMIKENTEKIIKSMSVFGSQTKVTSKYEGKLTGRYVTVEAEQKITIPFDAVISFFNKNGDNKLAIKASSTAALYDPDEYIRNIDYAVELSSDLVKQIKEKFSAITKNMKLGK